MQANVQANDLHVRFFPQSPHTAARLDALRKRAQPPESCGDEILVAPARGPCVAFQPRKVVQTSSGSWRDRRDGWQGRDAARVDYGMDDST